MWDGRDGSDASKQSFDQQSWSAAPNRDRSRRRPPNLDRLDAKPRRFTSRSPDESVIQPIPDLRAKSSQGELRSTGRQKPRPTPPPPPIQFPTEKRIDRAKSRRSFFGGATNRSSTPKELSASSNPIQFTERPRPRSVSRTPPQERPDRFSAVRPSLEEKRSIDPNSRRRLEVVPSPNRKSRPKPSQSRRVEPQSSPKPKLPKSARALLYGTRLLILGVGIGVLVGTILSVWDPASRFTAGASQSEKTEQPAPTETQPALPPLQLSQEISALKSQVQSAASGQTQFTPGLMIVDTDTQSYVEINSTSAFPAASTIKFPILVAFFQDVDAGKIRLDEMLTMRKELIAPESGELQYQPVGSQFSAIDVATRMITVSDNTATNMIIDRLGGKDALNQRFQSWGLNNTAIQNPLPDLNGTNTSSPRDMVTLLNWVNSGRIMSLRSHERLLEMMRRVVNNSLIPQGLGQGATIAHKTGDIGTVLGDVGIVDLPNGKRYLIAALVKRPFNDYRAGDLIRQVSQFTYQYFNQASTATAPPNANQASTVSPSPAAQDPPRPAAQ